MAIWDKFNKKENKDIDPSTTSVALEAIPLDDNGIPLNESLLSKKEVEENIDFEERRKVSREKPKFSIQLKMIIK